MGSSVLSALLEKYGYVNLPLRKTHISEYVTGKVELKNQKYKRKFIKLLKNMSNQLKFGGSSVLAKDKYKSLKRFKVNNKEIDISNLDLNLHGLCKSLCKEHIDLP